MHGFFRIHSILKKRARFLAVTWTLLIFIACFIPGQDIPDIDIPLIDKWAHVLLFAIFSLLWLSANESKSIALYFILFLSAIFIGWTTEYIQGRYIPGRFSDNMDIAADSIGALVGMLVFPGSAFSFRKR
jgi:VanZ family protein